MTTRRPEHSKILDIHPKEWNIGNDTLVLQYRNIEHFRYHCKYISNDKFEGSVKYSVALKDLLGNKGTMDQRYYDTIYNTVKSNLLKRGLISENIYESYKYDVEGSIVDVAKVIAEDPMCCLVPNTSYKSYFYEMYINVTISCTIKEYRIKETIAKILATVQLLEKEHIYIKINLVAYSKHVNGRSGNRLKDNTLIIVPVFSHKDYKDINIMSAVFNERTSRKFMFAIKEEYYGEDIEDSYGEATDLPNCLQCWGLNEIDLASDIINKVIIK